MKPKCIRTGTTLLHAVIKELMNASRFSILCVLEWLYRLASTVFGVFSLLASTRGTETREQALPWLSSRGESSTDAENPNCYSVKRALYAQLL